MPRVRRLLVLVCVVTGFLSHQVRAQQSFTWEQIRDKFLNTNPTLRAQAQGIESSRASEITASLRPNPTFRPEKKRDCYAKRSFHIWGMQAISLVCPPR